MTSKNILQEYFQKNNLELPKYKTQRLGGSDHQPVFVSEVTLYDGRVFSGEKEQNKKAAELSAAQKVLNEIDFKPPKGLFHHSTLKERLGYL
jgi:ribonuclease III